MKQYAQQALVAAVVIGLVVGAIVVFQPGGPLQLVDIADTDGDRPNNYCGRSVSDFAGSGQFPDPGGRAFGEAFTQTRIWTSWFQDGKSYPIFVEARLKACNQSLGFPSPPDNVYYRFLYSEDGSTWRGFAQGAQEGLGAGVYHTTITLGAVDKDVPLGAFSFAIDGFQWKPCTFIDNTYDSGRGPEAYDTQCDPTGETKQIQDGAALKVQVLVSRRNAPLGLNNYEAMLVFEDEVSLRSALPSVSWSRSGYTVGDTAVVQWTIPTDSYEECTASGTCATSPAYFLEVRNMNTNGALPDLDRVPLTVTSGNEAIPVLAEYFSNDLATCQNRLRALLYSQLIVVDQEDASVRSANTDLGINPPVLTGITADKDEYFEGDTVHLSWTATGTVTKYHVTAHIGGLLLLDKDIETTALQANASAVAPATGLLEVEVTPYNRCEPGDVKKETWTVGALYTGLCEQFPDTPQCKTADQDFFALIRVALLIIGLFALFLVLVWVLGRTEVLPPPWTLLVPVVIVLVAAAALFGAGYFALGLVLPAARRPTAPSGFHAGGR